eukprot:TRINITY_DN57964_c0_g1_i1.p1 TRINITY_DN57964_c0_g1~~TRINITY_DN57964_c0_g1_i1.p1  ORF type:complete len:321 (+),score=24.83 TRINITY_DN57964_c0_g1_i1:49-1011(+)
MTADSLDDVISTYAGCLPQNRLQLQVSTLTGETQLVDAHGSTSVDEICASIESSFGVPVMSQQWLVDGEMISLRKGITLDEAHLKHLDAVTVLRRACAQLMPLADVFKLELTSVRQRIRTGYSSAFTIIYKLDCDIPNRKLVYELWRKNDHDTFDFNGPERSVRQVISHWMSGARENGLPMIGPDPVEAFANGWLSATENPVALETWWRSAGSKDEQQHGQQKKHAAGARTMGITDDEGSESEPQYDRVPGWFTKPSDELVEVEVNIPLPATRRDVAKRICRFLVDPSGVPVRAAIKGCRIGCLHQDIEEFDVAFKKPES